MKNNYRFIDVFTCNMCGASTLQSSLIGLRLNCSQGLRPSQKEGVAVTVKRCNLCNLIYPSPIPIPFNIQDHYGVPPDEYWDKSYFCTDVDYFIELNDIDSPALQILYNQNILY
jgi:hypothetical protein